MSNEQKNNSNESKIVQMSKKQLSNEQKDSSNEKKLDQISKKRQYSNEPKKYFRMSNYFNYIW